MHTICLCVDDFGLHSGVNEAALQLAALGRVHAISCLVGGDGWGQGWCAMIRGLEVGGLDIGLHLDFTEAPLLAGSRRPLGTLINDSLLRRLDPTALRAEIRAQLDTFETLLGQAPAFVDGHQHVHQLPMVRDALLAELSARYGRDLPWLRSTRVASGLAGVHPASWAALVKPLGIEALGARALASRARRLGFAQNHGLLGVYDFQGGAARYRALLAAWLRRAADADLLICHPSMGRLQGDPLLASRHAEFDVLTEPAFERWLSEAGVALAPMSRLLSRPRIKPGRLSPTLDR